MVEASTRAVSRFAAYMDGKGYAQRTRDEYCKVLRGLLKHDNLLTIGPAALQSWVFDRTAGQATREQRYKAAVKFFAWAARVHWRTNNPARTLESPIRKQRRLPRPAPSEAVRAGLACDERTVRLAVACAALAGLRISEVAALEWQHVDFEAHTVTVLHGKGDKDRVVPLTPRLAQLLSDGGRRRLGPIFPGRFGGSADARWLSQMVAEWMREHGHDVTAHQFRHWYATQIYQATKDLILVQQLMGHADVSTTQVYCKISTVDFGPAVLAVDSAAA